MLTLGYKHKSVRDMFLSSASQQDSRYRRGTAYPKGKAWLACSCRGRRASGKGPRRCEHCGKGKSVALPASGWANNAW